VLSVKRGRHAMGSPFYVGTGRRIGWWGVARELETSWRLSDLLCLIRDTITCCKGWGEASEVRSTNRQGANCRHVRFVITCGPSDWQTRRSR
jgi:hypothetical protein